jgi:hypothetical protein
MPALVPPLFKVQVRMGCRAETIEGQTMGVSMTVSLLPTNGNF